MAPGRSPALPMVAEQRARVGKRPRSADVQATKLEEYETKLAITLVESVLGARASAQPERAATATAVGVVATTAQPNQAATPAPAPAQAPARITRTHHKRKADEAQVRLLQAPRAAMLRCGLVQLAEPHTTKGNLGV